MLTDKTMTQFYKEDCAGKKVFFNGMLKKDGKQYINPSKEMILAEGWQEYVPEPGEPCKPTYDQLVGQYIRERYTFNDELAVLRQQLAKPEAFQEYLSYCEECQRKAREEVAI